MGDGSMCHYCRNYTCTCTTPVRRLGASGVPDVDEIAHDVAIEVAAEHDLPDKIRWSMETSLRKHIARSAAPFVDVHEFRDGSYEAGAVPSSVDVLQSNSDALANRLAAWRLLHPHDCTCKLCGDTDKLLFRHLDPPESSPSGRWFTCLAAEEMKRCDFCEGGDVPVMHEGKYSHLSRESSPSGERG